MDRDRELCTKARRPPTFDGGSTEFPINQVARNKLYRYKISQIRARKGGEANVPPNRSLAVLLVGACVDVRELEITDENKDSLLEKIKDTSDLSVEEVQLLQGYILRKGMREALSGGDPSLPVGKRIGELIEGATKVRRG